MELSQLIGRLKISKVQLAIKKELLYHFYGMMSVNGLVTFASPF